MLTRNCALNKLFRKGDFNVRVTVYEPTNASNDPEKQKNAWIETIRDSIGGGIVNSSSAYVMQIHDENGCKVKRAVVIGNFIANIIRIYYKAPQPIRITLAPARSDVYDSNFNNTSEKVWIII